MGSSREYAVFIIDKFARLEEVTVRPMMGVYVIHYAGRVLGFIADEQLLLEPGPTISRLLPDAEYRELFHRSKRFAIVDDDINPSELCLIAESIYEDLPVSRPHPRKKNHIPGFRIGGDVLVLEDVAAGSRGNLERDGLGLQLSV